MTRRNWPPVSALARTLVVYAALTCPAMAQHIISGDRGGYIMDYTQKYDAWRASGRKVIIDGTCLSACTLVLGYIDPRRLCATHRAMLGFHSASLNFNGVREHAPGSTKMMYDTYPTHVQRWLDRFGGLDDTVQYVVAPEVYQLVRQCTPADLY